MTWVDEVRFESVRALMDQSDYYDILNALLALPAWHRYAACRGSGHAEFFPGRGASTEAAKAVCVACPVRVECLEHALADPELVGVWGGTSDRERRRMRRDGAA
jgi:WhiB family redox-sensing transcriptional regulator